MPGGVRHWKGLSDQQRCARRGEAETERDVKSKAETGTMRGGGGDMGAEPGESWKGKGGAGMIAKPRGVTSRGTLKVGRPQECGENERTGPSAGEQYVTGRGLRTGQSWTRGRSSQGQQRARGFHPLLAGAWRCRKEVFGSQTWAEMLQTGGRGTPGPARAALSGLLAAATSLSALLLRFSCFPMYTGCAHWIPAIGEKQHTHTHTPYWPHIQRNLPGPTLQAQFLTETNTGNTYPAGKQSTRVPGTD